MFGLSRPDGGTPAWISGLGIGEGVSGRGRSCVADRRSGRWCPRPTHRGAARASSGSEEPPHGVAQPERGGRSAPLPKNGRWPLHRLRPDRPPRLVEPQHLGAGAPSLSTRGVSRSGQRNTAQHGAPHTVRGRSVPGGAFALIKPGVLVRRRTAESAARGRGSRRSPDHQGPKSRPPGPGVGATPPEGAPGVVARATSGTPSIDAPPERATGRRAGT